MRKYTLDDATPVSLKTLCLNFKELRDAVPACDAARPLQEMLLTFEQLFMRAPGSRAAHHAWCGGWVHHTLEVLRLAYAFQERIGLDENWCTRGSIKRGRVRRFSDIEIATAAILHDVEKPFLYETTVWFWGNGGEDPSVPGETVHLEWNTTTNIWVERAQELKSKPGRKQFREELAEEFGIPLSDDVRNALAYAEGEGDDYVPGKRIMGPLAAIIHAADVISARALFDAQNPRP